MPRYSEPAELTPFAQLLVDYMWNRRSPNRPPMNVPQLAARLGMPRQNVHNWIFRSTVPTFEIILAVLARLDIPLRDLYDAYRRAGMTVPHWDKHDTADNAAPNQEQPAISRSRKPTAIQFGYDDQPAGLYPTSGHEPLPYTPPAPPAEEAEDWDALVRQTERLLREEGLSDKLIAAAIAGIRSRQSGEQTPLQRSIIAEHTEPDPDPASEPSRQQDQKQQRKSPEDARK